MSAISELSGRTKLTVALPSTARASEAEELRYDIYAAKMSVAMSSDFSLEEITTEFLKKTICRQNSTPKPT